MKHFKYIALAALAFSISAVNAQAGWVSGFNGNTVFGIPNADGDGVVNFAVWENIDGDWTDGDFSFATGNVTAQFDASAIFLLTDTGAKYVYFYQVVNSDPAGGISPDPNLNTLRVPVIAASDITSAGFIDSFVFQEVVSGVDTAVGPSTNQQLGTNNQNILDTPGDGTPTQGNVGTPLFTSADGTEVDPISVEFNAGVVKFNFLNTGSTSVIGPDEFTSILFMTSDKAPKYAAGTLVDGISAKGDIPTTVPAPAGLVLLLTGLPGLAGFGWYQRRQKNKVTA